MSDSPEKIIRKLISVGAVVNVGLEENAPHHVSVGAGRSLLDAVKQVADNDDLWWRLGQQALRSREVSELASTGAAGGLPSGSVFERWAAQARHTMVIDHLADLLTENHALILIRMGYRTPPPPPASKLVDETRKALIEISRQPSSLPPIEEARAALNRFADEVSKRLPGADTNVIRRILGHGKRLLPSVVLLVACLHPAIGIETGSEYSVDFGISTDHAIEAKVTVPRPWNPEIAGGVATHAVGMEVQRQATSGAESLASEQDDERYLYN